MMKQKKVMKVTMKMRTKMMMMTMIMMMMKSWLQVRENKDVMLASNVYNRYIYGGSCFLKYLF